MPVSEAERLLATQIAYADLNEARVALSVASGGKPVTVEAALEYSVATGKSLSHFEKYLDPDTQKLKEEYSYANDWVIASAVNENTPSGSGLYACILDTGDSHILACRGSEDMSDMMNWEQDWYEADLKLLNSEMTAQEAALLRYMNANKDLLNEKPWVATGHSLGGALADFAAISSVKLELNNFSGATNFDGPGHSQEFIEEYSDELSQVAAKMVHKKASIVGYLLFDLPGVKNELIETAEESQFLDKDGNPYPLETDIPILNEHSTQTWVLNEDGSLAEGERDWYEFLVEKFSRGVDRLPSAIGNQLPRLINLAVVGANWIKELYEDRPTLVEMVVSGLSIYLLSHPGIAIMTIQVAVAVVSVVFVSLVVLVFGEIIIETLEKIAEEIAQAISVGISWLSDKAVDLYEALKETIGKISQWLHERYDRAGIEYAAANPYFHVDTEKLRHYADRVIAVNGRLKQLDQDLNGLYWQVGLLDILDILSADFATGKSLALDRVTAYLSDAAERFEKADSNALRLFGG